ncbi:hypothetical protein H0A43_07500 [Arcobacter lanthieri]|uniref:hypothetical protein n=1 Tax=Aliarcobacter lanthieri TaxID=1355374 RepID=UPI001921958F|nr:hypothetical protein [Aliarcobacter lanthieri]MBL3520317.1 hypothetical protein [Aliarcobacter lanthieri]
MIIKFNPQKAETQTTASIKGNILTYNKDKIDLNSIPDGATATNEFLTINKDLEGNIEISMLWQYTENTKENCFPKDLEIENGDICPKESTNAV